MKAMFPWGSSVFIIPSGDPDWKQKDGDVADPSWWLAEQGRELMGSLVEGGGLGIQTGQGGLWEPESGKGAGVSA